MSVCFKTSPARAKWYLGQPVRVSVGFGPARLGLGPFHFYLISCPFKLFQISFRYDFQTLIPRVLEIHF
jgi:hypothetical protein